jgi:hypothetical protein
VLGGALGEVKPLIADVGHGGVPSTRLNARSSATCSEITNLKGGMAVLATVGATAPFVDCWPPRWAS